MILDRNQPFDESEFEISVKFLKKCQSKDLLDRMTIIARLPKSTSRPCNLCRDVTHYGEIVAEKYKAEGNIDASFLTLPDDNYIVCQMPNPQF